MTAPVIFGLIVRVVGLGFLAYSVMYLYALVAALVVPHPSQPPTEYVVAFFGAAIAGWVFMRGAPWLVRFAYRVEEAPANKKQHEPG